METLQLINLKPQQLADLIKEGVKSELELLKKELLHENANDELLTREQAADLLHINLSTLYHWTLAKKLNAYGIAGRRFYKRSEIMDALVLLKK